MPSFLIHRAMIRPLSAGLVFVSIGVGAALAWGQSTGATPQATSHKDTLWIIPHTHWEGAVFKTREEYLQMGLVNISAALHLLAEHPEYRFVLDQVAYVRPYLERYPEDRAAFRKFVEEGRLQLVGGTDVMPDVNMPSGESFVRQILYGKTYYRDQLGVDVTVGWNLDTFGHHAQMPQILKGAGYKSYWFFRGVPSLSTPSEFMWQGIDGTQIPAFWLPWGYALFYDPPATPSEFARFARERFAMLTPFARGSDRVALDGADVSEPEGHLPDWVKQFDQDPSEPLKLRLAVPTEFEAAVATRGDRQVVAGELNPIFQGIYSSRIELKQWMRRMENTLSNAERLAALSQWLGRPADADRLMRAWEPVLFNQTHDLASGVMVDKVYEDVLRGYEYSRRSADEIAQASLDKIAAQIDTRGKGVPIAVFNALGWTRTDVAETEVEFSTGGIRDLGLVDPAGQPVPVQLSEVSRYDDGGIRHAHLVFVAKEVPGLGFTVYWVVPLPTSVLPPKRGPAPRLWGATSTAQEDQGAIENEFYRVVFNLWTGEITSLVDKASGWESLRAPGNVVSQEPDGGDLWQLYGNLNGARNVAMARPVPAPDRTRSRFSNEWLGGSGRTTAGPVFSEYRVSHPFGQGNFSTQVRLYAGVPRVDIETRILNNDAHVRYRALFPAAVQDGKRTDEIPFGAIGRPQEQEFPAQNWMDYGDGSHGLALLNCGMPGNNVADGTLMLSLLRSAAINAYGYGGGYETGVSSDSGLEMGRTLTLHYALLPHAGDWRKAGVARAGWELNNPLVVRKLETHTGSLPPRWGWVEVSSRNAVLSAIKPGRDGSVIMRLYESSGQPSPELTVRVSAEIASAHEANLLEDSGNAVRVVNNTLYLDLKPFEIRTVKLNLRPPQPHISLAHGN